MRAFVHQSDLDKEVLDILRTSEAGEKVVDDFIALREIVPLAIQISEEAQYIECKMLWPLTSLVLKNVRNYLIGCKKISTEEEIKDYDADELLQLINKTEDKK